MIKILQKLTSALTNVSKKTYVPLITRIVSLLFFVLLMAAFFFGSITIFRFPFTSNLAMIIVWVLWWPFLYITLFLFARIWCGFLCPISLANEAGNYLRKGKVINYRKWAFIPFVLFFIIVYLEQVSGLFLSISMTLTFFVLFFLFALFMGMILSRYSFCKLICPIGTLLGVFNRLSIIGLRTKKEICEKCPKKFCILGGKTSPCPMFNNVPKINSNKDCLLCTKCIKNCPYDSPYIGVIKPGKELEDKVNFNFSESYFIVALFGLAFILTSSGTTLARKILSIFPIVLNGASLRAVDFLIAITLFIGLFTLFGFISARVLKVKIKQILSEMGYYLLPTIFFIMFFTITFGFLGPWLPVEDIVVKLFKYFFLGIGFVWSIILIRRIKLPTNSNVILSKKIQFVKLLQVFFLLIIVLTWAGVIISDPLNIVTTNASVHYAVPGEVIKMEAYSMGFTPKTIVVEKGTPVILDITNLDITHAFDIDKFDIHYILKGDETIQAMFTPNDLGEFAFHCSIPGHTEAGMKGKIIVVDKI